MSRDYDLARDLAQERQLVEAEELAERRAAEQEMAEVDAEERRISESLDREEGAL